MRLRDYLVQCILCPVSHSPPVLSLMLGIRVNAGSLGGRHGHQHLDITVMGVIRGMVVIVGVIMVITGMVVIVGMVVILVITMIIGDLRFSGGVDVFSGGVSNFETTVPMMLLRWRWFVMVVVVFVIMVVRRNMIMGMIVIMIYFYQDQGEDGGELHDGVW